MIISKELREKMRGKGFLIDGLSGNCHMFYLFPNESVYCVPKKKIKDLYGFLESFGKQEGDLGYFNSFINSVAKKADLNNERVEWNLLTDNPFSNNTDITFAQYNEKGRAIDWS